MIFGYRQRIFPNKKLPYQGQKSCRKILWILNTLPVGVLSDSVMTFMGEALIYAASVFGMKAYVEQKIGERNKSNNYHENN